MTVGSNGSRPTRATEGLRKAYRIRERCRPPSLNQCIRVRGLVPALVADHPQERHWASGAWPACWPALARPDARWPPHGGPAGAAGLLGRGLRRAVLRGAVLAAAVPGRDRRGRLGGGRALGDAGAGLGRARRTWPVWAGPSRPPWTASTHPRRAARGQTAAGPRRRDTPRFRSLQCRCRCTTAGSRRSTPPARRGETRALPGKRRPLRHRLEVVHGLGSLHLDYAGQAAPTLGGVQDQVRIPRRGRRSDRRSLFVSGIDGNLELPLVLGLQQADHPIVLELLADGPHEDGAQ